MTQGTVTEMSEWQALQNHQQLMKNIRTEDLFKSDPNRETNYCSAINAVQVDYSRHHFDEITLQLLFDFAGKNDISTYIHSFFSENKLNYTENKPVLHHALRFPSAILEQKFNLHIKDQIESSLLMMKELSQQIRAGELHGTKIKHVLHLGVGGSDLGSRMAIKALESYLTLTQSIDFVSNLDPDDLNSALIKLDPQSTLVIISSKSFTTYETLHNAQQVINWLGSSERVKTQCVAITANKKNALQFGIEEKNILPIWGWVGGRFSIWSTMGFIISIAIGYEAFQDFLNGAYLVDEHIQTAPLWENLPLRLALIDCWNINFMGGLTRAVIPYSVKLSYLTPYLQQLVMESNGKSVDINGNPLNYHTGPIIWGGIGCDSQHAFHQLLMQGTQLVPIDFVAIKYANQTKNQPQQDTLNHQLKAQSNALLNGNTLKKPSPHQMISGNVPHTVFTLDYLTPSTLGTLLAIYEYRTILLAHLWRINPFDQFGVELGKELAIQKGSMETGQAISVEQ